MSLPLTNPVGFPMALRTDLSNATLGQPAGQPAQPPVDLSQVAPQPTATPVAQTAPPSTEKSSPKDIWDDPATIAAMHQATIDNITQKYTDPNNPNPNISDDDKKALTDAYQQLALQSTPWERTKKTTAAATGAAGDWLKSHPLVATGAALGGPVGAGIGLVASPGFWNDASNVWGGIKKAVLPSEGETPGEYAVAGTMGIGQGVQNAWAGLGTDVRSFFQLGDSRPHTVEAMEQGVNDANEKARQISLDATMKDTLNTLFSGNQQPGQPTPAALAEPQLQAGETVGGITGLALPGAAFEKSWPREWQHETFLSGTANKAVDLGNVVAGKTLQGVGNLINHPVVQSAVNSLNNPVVRSGIGGALGLSTGGIPGAVIDSLIGGGLGPIASRVTSGINAALDSTA